MLFCVTCENDIKRDTEVTPIASMANEMEEGVYYRKKCHMEPIPRAPKKKKSNILIKMDHGGGARVKVIFINKRYHEIKDIYSISKKKKEYEGNN